MPNAMLDSELATPRRWDPEQTAAAVQLDRAESGWHVMYGSWSRRFFAIALWSDEPVMVYAHTAGELREVMRDVEAEAMERRFRPSVRVA
ncbi:hypothetical protein DQ384_17835 [Sphaerisporangium album]|uniref:Uncharacterized protein n=1 Tax=Sphaerisporangium album TaxID=509200 RepID=A0A367FJE4_9ACTN|nr:hypothetical protein DQ384_17835 [Sphaerisporangium album]